MIKRWSLQHVFTREYAKAIVYSSSSSPQPLANLAKDLRTVVVDAPNLTDGTQTYLNSWALSGVADSTRETASRATCLSDAPLMSGLHRASTLTPLQEKPVAHGGEAVEWTAWHRGKLFEITMAGSLDTVLDYCDLTENEREHIITRARALSRSGHVVFATARTTQYEAAPTRGSLAFDGLLVCELHLLPHTREAIVHLRRQGIRLVYMTAGPEDLSMYVAHAAGITEHPKSARHGDFVSSSDHDIYAHVTRVNARRLIHALPQPLLVARHPLVDITSMLDSFR